jgi:hypothetical protein
MLFRSLWFCARQGAPAIVIVHSRNCRKRIRVELQRGSIQYRSGAAVWHCAKRAPRNHERRGVADAAAANPFSFTQTYGRRRNSWRAASGRANPQ